MNGYKCSQGIWKEDEKNGWSWNQEERIPVGMLEGRMNLQEDNEFLWRLTDPVNHKSIQLGG